MLSYYLRFLYLHCAVRVIMLSCGSHYSYILASVSVANLLLAPTILMCKLEFLTLDKIDPCGNDNETSKMLP